MTMKKKLILHIPAPIIALVLEILPYGAVLNFANPTEYESRLTYSYFDLTPFGYANFGPFLTAILSCVLLVLLLVGIFTQKQGFKTVAEIICFFALGTSLMPLLLGTAYFSAIGAAISVMLAIELALLLFEDKIIK